MDRGIIVSGEGEVRATPDVLAVTLEVETRAGTVAEARAMNTEAAAKLIAVLKAGGIAERDIQTRNISVNAEYDRPDRGAPSVAGYVVSNSIRVSLRDLEKAGGTIDDALAAAGDAGRLGGIRFDFSKPAPLYVEARIRACRDAREKAQALAAGMGVKLGKLISVVEGAPDSGPQPRMAMFAARVKESMPIEAGESFISASVTARYAIKE